MFWVEPAALADEAESLIRHRGAQLVNTDADAFFTDLRSKIEDIEILRTQHPFDVTVAVEETKKLIPHAETQIKLEDLLKRESDRAYEAFLKLFESPMPELEKRDFYLNRLEVCFSTAEILIAMATTLCWYGKQSEQLAVLRDILSRWATPVNHMSPGMPIWSRMPCLLLIYGCGMAALYQERWNYFRSLLADVRIDVALQRDTRTILDWVNVSRAFNLDAFRGVSETETPSAHIRNLLREIFRPHIPEDRKYYQLFSLFEMVMVIIYLATDEYAEWIPHFSGTTRYGSIEGWKHMTEFWVKGAEQGVSWGFLQRMFDGDVELLLRALDRYYDMAGRRDALGRPRIPNYPGIYRGEVPPNAHDV
jgi:hypothetical protein